MPFPQTLIDQTPRSQALRRGLPLWLCLWLLSPLSAMAEAAAPPNTAETSVAQRVETLKQKVIQLNRDLFILEEDLLFPANTQFAVFLSLDTGKFIQLDAAKLNVDGEIVAAHLYTDRQVSALQRGGMQRLHMGNLKQGKHEITAFIEGIGPENRPYKIAAQLAIDKGTDSKLLEIRIKDQSANYQPSVELVEWD